MRGHGKCIFFATHNCAAIISAYKVKFTYFDAVNIYTLITQLLPYIRISSIQVNLMYLNRNKLTPSFLHTHVHAVQLRRSHTRLNKNIHTNWQVKVAVIIMSYVTLCWQRTERELKLDVPGGQKLDRTSAEGEAC